MVMSPEEAIRLTTNSCWDLFTKPEQWLVLSDFLMLESRSGAPVIEAR